MPSFFEKYCHPWLASNLDFKQERVHNSKDFGCFNEDSEKISAYLVSRNWKIIKLYFAPKHHLGLVLLKFANFVTYRDLILKHEATKIGAFKYVSELSQFINVLDALCFFRMAGNKVNSATIENCFIKDRLKTADGKILHHCNPENKIPLHYYPLLYQTTSFLQTMTEKSFQ